MDGFPPSGFTLEILSREHRRKRFSSGDPRVDDWLIHKALSAMEKSTSTTRLLVAAGGEVAGYYTLANTALDVSLVPPAMFGGKVPSRMPPTLTLAWLGVDRRFQGRGLGTLLFLRALADGVEVYQLVRFVAVIVDALTEENRAFYEGHGFLPVPGTASKLYLPASTLMQIAPPD
jgi:ribosomal protein S18 acetylase RimI-like enzyme